MAATPSEGISTWITSRSEAMVGGRVIEHTTPLDPKKRARWTMDWRSRTLELVVPDKEPSPLEEWTFPPTSLQTETNLGGEKCRFTLSLRPDGSAIFQKMIWDPKSKNFRIKSTCYLISFSF